MLATSGAVLGRRAAKRAGYAELRLKHIRARKTGISAAVYWDANKLGASAGATGLTAVLYLCCVPKALGTFRH